MPARVTEVRPGSSWTWRVGPVSLVHVVRRRPTGCEVAIELHAPAALEAALAFTYGPVVALLVRRLARVASAGA